jgi:prevent-host-death family protein
MARFNGQKRQAPVGKISVAEAKDRLPALISAAQAGETVTITRHGTPVAELRGVTAAGGVDPASIDWIAAQLDGVPLAQMTGAETVRAMRDED